MAGLANTDERVQAGKSVTPTFLFTLLLYGPIAAHIEQQPPEQWGDVGTILDACDAAVREAARRVTIPKRFSLGVRDMFALQPQLEHPRSRRVLQADRAAAFPCRLRPAAAARPGGHGAAGAGGLVGTHCRPRLRPQRHEMALALEAARGHRGGAGDSGAGDG